ncbi:hypothetical protein L5M38_08850 [Shewanella sp. SM101]|uniref:hypothetical protein n=1 Tax=Shewanella sp. SM101 TaxID=2912789 RepID=UPI0021DB1EA4|nr:hypothetical protein [Shewanella sp. SM101]MCU8104649.1 hypothetical protein [Shewanella sp. SM101]
MFNYIPYVVEVLAFSFIFICILTNLKRFHYLVSFCLFFVMFFLAVFIFGFYKSSYHALILVLLFFSFIISFNGKVSFRYSSFFIKLIFFILIFLMISSADFTFSDKTNMPKLFPLWAVLMVLFKNRSSHLIRFLIFSLLFIDLFFALKSSARGISLGLISAIYFYKFRPNCFQSTLPFFLIFAFLLYILLQPILLYFSSDGLLNSSASNFQRVMMNISSVKHIVNYPFMFNETLIFTSVDEYRYAHDSDKLTVHNIILAFSLFNGWLSGLLLLCLISFSAKRFYHSNYLPIFIYMFGVLMLGPDAFDTRIYIMLIALMLINVPVSNIRKFK